MIENSTARVDMPYKVARVQLLFNNPIPGKGIRYALFYFVFIRVNLVINQCIYI